MCTSVAGVKVWNSPNKEMQSMTSVFQFKKMLNTKISVYELESLKVVCFAVTVFLFVHLSF